MARTLGSFGDKTAARIRESAIKLIARHSFDAMSMRDLGAEAGIGAPALYRYFPTKQALLWTLIDEHLEQLMASWAQVASNTSLAETPIQQLDRFVGNHITFHVERRLMTQIANFDLRGLEKANLTAALRKRNVYEKYLKAILREGQASKAFAQGDVELTALAIIQMITSVVIWFRPGEAMPVKGVIEQYQQMVKRLVGAQA
jgi:AcrR family transcriptional regulator